MKDHTHTKHIDIQKQLYNNNKETIKITRNNAGEVIKKGINLNSIK